MTLTKQRDVFAEIANRVAHLRGTGRAVEPDDVDVQRVERRADRADVGAQQHAPFGDERRLRLNRDAAHSARELAPDSRDRRLELEQILHRLEQQQIDAAFDERARLLGVDVAQLLVRDLRERRIRRRDQHPGRSHRAGDEARALRRRERVAGLARERRRAQVDLARSLAEPVLVELQSRRR